MSWPNQTGRWIRMPVYSLAAAYYKPVFTFQWLTG